MDPEGPWDLVDVEEEDCSDEFVDFAMETAEIGDEMHGNPMEPGRGRFQEAHC
jgi:hypothetical protein